MSLLSKRRLIVLGVLYCCVFTATCAVGGLAYFHFGNPKDTCAACHEMTGVYSHWRSSSHRTIHCRECHGGSLTLDVHALQSHVERLVRHLTGDPNSPVHLQGRHVRDLNLSCGRCHPQALADWQASRHSTTYARFFLDPEHNRQEPPSNDCLRCHGMFFQGDITALVATAPGAGWRLQQPALAVQAAIPCLSCHQVHASADDTRDGSFYDRREQSHIPAYALPVPHIQQGERAVKVSLDPRQRSCLQCHAPDPAHQLASSDDRTPAGVHEGLSCADCHPAHGRSSALTCNACHPADSHCGIPVEKMDTSFLSPTSTHNVHTVACMDCHPQGIPKKAPMAK